MVSDFSDDDPATTNGPTENLTEGAPMTTQSEGNRIEPNHDPTQISNTTPSATTPSLTNVTSAWANTPPSNDHCSVYSEPPHSYEVPLHDPDNVHSTTRRSNQSTGGSSRIRSAVASSSSRKQQSSGSNSGRGSYPLSTFNDRDSTIAGGGGSETVWDTELNTPRMELSMQERITNTAISGTIELLKQVGGVTVSATGALVAPPLHITRTVLLPSLYAAFKEFIASHSPVRLKDWFRIFSSSFHHIVNTLQNTESGHAFSNRMVLIMIDLIDCFSAETTRQLLLDGMSCFVKFFDIIHTPTFQSYCEQLTITGCRLIDALSNGRNKLLLHDIQQAVTGAGEVLADPATTVALAEVTAYLIYALEMEDQQIQIDERKRSGPTTTATTMNGVGGPRRQERDTYQSETSLKRDTLDIGHTVEDAILSSLGISINDSARNPSTTSIPASIILDTQQPTKSSLNDGPSVPNLIKNKDGSKSLEWCDRARNDVDVQVLREGLIHRTSTVVASLPTKQTTIGASKRNERNKDIVINDDRDKGLLPNKEDFFRSLLDLEEPCALKSVRETNGDDDRESKPRKRQQSIELRPSTDDDEPETDAINGTSSDYDHVGLLPTPQDDKARKEGESANAHFYRILDEILGEKRDEEASKVFAEQMARPEGFKGGVSRHLRQPEQGNPTIKDRLNAIRLEMKASGYNAATTNKKQASVKLNQTGRKVILFVAIVTLLIIAFWFLLGCYGLYIYFNPSAALISQRSITRQETNSVQREIIVRVVREAVHVNQDGKDFGHGLFQETRMNLEDNIDYEEVADCVASAVKW